MSVMPRESKKLNSDKIKQFIYYQLFFGLLLGFLGYFLTEYRLLRPASSSPSRIEIRATGERDDASKSSEVWFYGAFRETDDSKIPWSEFELDASWEKRDDIYVSYNNQPSMAILKYDEPIRLDFGSHPYSGIVNVKWKNGDKRINLYSESSEVKSVAVDPLPTYKNSKAYPFVIIGFVLCGSFFAAGLFFIGWRVAYRWIFGLLLLFSLYLTLSAYFPGVYTNDSADQLRQALTGHYHDWHPPVMAWLWSVLIKATGRVESLMVFHLLLLMAGAIYWAKIFDRLLAKFSAFFIPAFVASPIVVNFSGVIWKDVGFAFSLFLCCGIVGLSVSEKYISLGRTIAVVILLTYAFAIRPNGIFAIYPIAMPWTWLIVSRLQPKYSKNAVAIISVATSFLLLTVVIASIKLFSYQYLKAEQRYPFQYVELYDIAGISTISGVDHFPDFIKESSGHNIKRIAEGYASSISVLGNANNLLFGNQDGSAPLIPLNIDAALQMQLVTSWLKAIREEPSAYLEHRWSVTNFLMSKGFYSSEKPQNNDVRKSVFEANSLDPGKVNIFDFHFPGGDGSKKFVAYSTGWLKGSFLYVGWFWLFLLLAEFLAGLMIMSNARSGSVIVMISSSGLLYMLPYLIVAPASDFRYLYWSSISGGIAAIFVIVLAVVSALSRVGVFAGHAPEKPLSNAVTNDALRRMSET